MLPPVGTNSHDQPRIAAVRGRSSCPRANRRHFPADTPAREPTVHRLVRHLADATVPAHADPATHEAAPCRPRRACAPGGLHRRGGPSQPPTPTAPPASVPPSEAPEPSETPEPSEPAAPPVVGFEPAEVPTTENSTAITVIARREGELVAIGFDGGFGSLLWASGDGGRTWTDLGEPLEGAFFAGAFATDDGLLLVGATQAGPWRPAPRPTPPSGPPHSTSDADRLTADRMIGALSSIRNPENRVRNR